MVLGTAAVAFAAPALTLTSTRSAVTYPQPTWLKLVSADGAVSVPDDRHHPVPPHRHRDVDESAGTIAATRTAEGTVTVPVASVPPEEHHRVPSNRRGPRERGHDRRRKGAPVGTSGSDRASRRGRRVTVKGFIWPRHAVGSRPVAVTVWKWEGGGWVEKGIIHPKIVGQDSRRLQVAVHALGGRRRQGQVAPAGVPRGPEACRFDLALQLHPSALVRATWTTK